MELPLANQILSPLEWSVIFDKHLEKNARGGIHVDVKDLEEWSHCSMEYCLGQPDTLKRTLTNASKGLKKCRIQANLHLTNNQKELVWWDDEDPVDQFIDKLDELVTIDGTITMVGPIETATKTFVPYCCHCHKVFEFKDASNGFTCCLGQPLYSMPVSTEEGRRFEVTLFNVVYGGGIIAVTTTVKGLPRSIHLGMKATITGFIKITDGAKKRRKHHSRGVELFALSMTEIVPQISVLPPCLCKLWKQGHLFRLIVRSFGPGFPLYAKVAVLLATLSKADQHGRIHVLLRGREAHILIDQALSVVSSAKAGNKHPLMNFKKDGLQYAGSLATANGRTLGFHMIDEISKKNCSLEGWRDFCSSVESGEQMSITNDLIPSVTMIPCAAQILGATKLELSEVETAPFRPAFDLCFDLDTPHQALPEAFSGKQTLKHRVSGDKREKLVTQELECFLRKMRELSPRFSEESKKRAKENFHAIAEMYQKRFLGYDVFRIYKILCICRARCDLSEIVYPTHTDDAIEVLLQGYNFYPTKTKSTAARGNSSQCTMACKLLQTNAERQKTLYQKSELVHLFTATRIANPEKMIDEMNERGMLLKDLKGRFRFNSKM